MPRAQSGKLRHNWKPLLLKPTQKPREDSPSWAGPQMTEVKATCLRNPEPSAGRGPQGPPKVPCPSPKASPHHGPWAPALPSTDSLSLQLRPVLRACTFFPGLGVHPLSRQTISPPHPGTPGPLTGATSTTGPEMSPSTWGEACGREHVPKDSPRARKRERKDTRRAGA